MPDSALRPPSSGFSSQLSAFSPTLPPPSSLLPSPARGRSAAFTLVELLIGASLSAAVLAAVLSSYIYLGRQLGRLAHQQTLETEARRTLGIFTQDAQRATDVTVTPVTAPDFYVTFGVPRTTAGVTRVIYYYSRNGTTTSISGNSVTVPARSLIRVESTGSAIVGGIQTVLRNTLATDEGCALRFYDANGNPYDNNAPPYTPVTTYWPGVRQVSLQFATQIVTVNAGTSTGVQRETTGRLALRNRTFLQ